MAYLTLANQLTILRVALTPFFVLAVVYATAFEVAAVSVYAAGLLTMLVLSATYNLWPISRAKWLLRRFDHSAIYVLIAATYTLSGVGLALTGWAFLQGWLDARSQALAWSAVVGGQVVGAR